VLPRTKVYGYFLAQEEVPPTNSQATGISEFTAAGGGIEYTVDASNIQVLQRAHSQR